MYVKYRGQIATQKNYYKPLKCIHLELIKKSQGKKVGKRPIS